MALNNLSSTWISANEATTTAVTEVPTAAPTFRMNNTNGSTFAYEDGPANFPPMKDICVAEVFATGFGLISIIGTIGNLLVITSLFVNKKLRTSLNAFITSMAIGDLIFAGVHEPLSAQALAIGGWTYQSVLCTVLGAATVASASQSLIASNLIAINRYILISYPHTVYRKFFTPLKTALMIAVSWTLSVLVVLPPLMGFGELGYNPASSVCDFAVDNPSTFTYFLTIPGVLVFLTNGITVFCYLKIYQKVKESAANAHRVQPNNAARQVPGKVIKQTKHMFVMFVTFCICTTPYSIFYTFDRDMSLSKCLWQTLTFLFACNSSINPIIHTCRSRDYRDAFRYIVCCGRRRTLVTKAKVKKITVKEMDFPKTEKRDTVAAEAPGSPASDSTETSPLSSRPKTIAATHAPVQPMPTYTTGFKRGSHSVTKKPSLLVVHELPAVSV